MALGHLHDNIILLLRPLTVLLSCANEGFCFLDLTGTTKFKHDEKKSEKNSGRSSTVYNVATGTAQQVFEWGG